MAWLKIDDGMMEHPKILGLSDREFRVHMKALGYTARRRDPHVPRKALPMFEASMRHAARLEESGLWDRNGDGWVIHDWDEYNPERRLKSDRQQRWRDGKNDTDVDA